MSTWTPLPLSPPLTTGADEDRLIWVVYQLRARVRAAPHQPFDHHAWLCSQLRDVGELTALVFIQAALLPDVEISRLLAWWRERCRAST